MRVPAVDEIAVDLIRAQDQAAAQAQIGHTLQFSAGEHPPSRVVRIAEQQQPRLRRDGGLQPVEVDLVTQQVPIGHRHKLGHRLLPSEIGAGIKERGVDRRCHQNGVTGRSRAEDDHVQPEDEAGQRHDPIRIDRPTAARRHALGDEGAQCGRVHLVTEHGVRQPVLDRLDHGWWHGEFHVRHPHRQHIRADEIPFDAVGAAPVDAVLTLEIHDAIPRTR